MTTARLEAQQRKSLRARFVVGLVLRRNSTTLAAQDVAIFVRERAGQERRSESGEAVQADVEIWGPSGLNIQRGDRFTWDGVAHEVILVRPGRTLATVAEAMIIQ